MAHADTLARQPSARSPAVGGRWRINFSRVEARGEINWTWGPQIVWQPRMRRYEGQVNMHLPDAWGYVEFAPADATSCGQSVEAAIAAAAEPSAQAAHAAMVTYYAMHAYREASGSFAGASAEELSTRGLLDDAAMASCDLQVTASEHGAGFVATATHATASGVAARVNQERLVVLEQGSCDE